MVKIKTETGPDSITPVVKRKTQSLLRTITSFGRRESSQRLNDQPISTVSPDTGPSRLQRILGDRYRFEGFLGRGGFAAVFKVNHLQLARTEALKVLLETHDNDPEFAERFANEAKMAASLDHPNIIKVYDFGQQEGIFWYSMQYIEGPSLSAILHAKNSLDEISVARLALPLLDALEYSHQRGIIHRDIKPGNIILDSRARPYLMDFGIAKSMDSLFKTRTGLFLGTPVYIAPEQASGKQKLDGRADLYALGVTLYQMLTGGYPFPADDFVQTVISRLTHDPEPISKKRSDIDSTLESIVMRALERDRDKRFSTAGEMRRSLVNFCGEEGSASDMDLTSVLAEAFQNVTPISQDPDLYIPTLMDPKPLKGEAASRRWFFIRPLWRRIAALMVVLAVLIVVLVWQNRRFSPTEYGTQLKNTETMVTPAKTLSDETNESGPVESSFPSSDDDGNSSTDSVTGKTQHETSSPATDRKTAITSPGDKKTQTAMPASEYGVRSKVDPPSTPPEPVRRRPVQRARLLETVEPAIPPELIEKCAGQTVNVSVVIGENGRVVKAKIISSGHLPVCAEAVREAVLQYVYQPALDMEGKPTESTIAVAVEIFGGKL